MKISILVPNLSSNCLGRAYLLAKILQRRYDIEIIGPLFGKSIWSPVKGDKNILYKYVKIYDKYVKIYGALRSYITLSKLLREITGDVIYAVKPQFTSFGIGLIKSIISGTPIVLDIDDWEMGFIKFKQNNKLLGIRNIFSSFLHLYKVGTYWNSLIHEKLVFLAKELTVSNSFLQDKFGGSIIYHGRDTKVFDPDKFDKLIYRKKYKIEYDKKIIMFFGTPNIYKGLEDLINAIFLINRKDIILVIVGLKGDTYCKNIINLGKELLKKRFIAFGIQSFEKIPEFHCMSDIVVIPQRKNLATLGQFPAKVFDAMAMAKPIIATKVNDLPLILDDCGWIVEPENPKELSSAILYILDNPREAERRGQNARIKCIENYSWDAIEKVIVKMFKKYE